MRACPRVSATRVILNAHNSAITRSQSKGECMFTLRSDCTRGTEVAAYSLLIQNSSVGTSWIGFPSRTGMFLFTTTPRSALWLTQPPFAVFLWLVPGELSDLSQVLRYRMHRALHLRPPYASVGMVLVF